MAEKLTSLTQALEKLLEAEFFLEQLSGKSGLEFQFFLNAFLSASRSVTFVLQYSMNHVAEFEKWYANARKEMGKDEAMKFFLELRNVSQKEGPVSFISGGKLGGGRAYRFVGIEGYLPRPIANRDVVECGRDHIGKLGKLLKDFAESFPYHACPAEALTLEGMQVLGYRMADVERWLGLPEGYTDVPGVPNDEKLKYLSREIAALDISEIERISRFASADGKSAIMRESSDLLDDVVESINNDSGQHPRVYFLEGVLNRIKRSENEKLDRNNDDDV